MLNLQGVWKTGTLPFPDGCGAFQAELRFQHGQVENLHHEFADVEGPHLSTSCRKATYTLTGNKLHLTAISSSITVQSPEQAAQFNASKAGGFDDWFPGKEKDVTGLTLLGHSYAGPGESSVVTITVKGDSLETDTYPGLTYRRAAAKSSA
jgi:hypothetical protein